MKLTSLELYINNRGDLEAELRDVMRRMHNNDEQFLETIDAYPMGMLCDVVHGKDSRKPRTVRMRIIGRSVRDAIAWYTCTSNIDGTNRRGIIRFVSHAEVTPAQDLPM